MAALQKLQDNNLDLLRFIFAAIVFFVHTYHLSGSNALLIIDWMLSSTFAVKSFFVVSGFLIFMSYENSNRLSTYFSKRLRRIYPAYFTVVVLCALLGAFFSELSVNDYFSVDWLKYLFANLLFFNFIHPDLPGLFTNNTLSAVNGALWTLKIEVMFYLCVPFFVWMIRKWGTWQVLLTLYALSLLYRLGIESWGIATNSPIYPELLRQLPGQLMYFIAGAVLYYYLAYFRGNWRWLLMFAVFVLLFKRLLPWIEPMALAIVVIYLACIFPCLGNFGKYGDFSYGIYIVHFPILQVLVQYGLFETMPLVGFVVAAVLVLLVSYLSWHLIEKRFLRKSSHYLKAIQ